MNFTYKQDKFYYRGEEIKLISGALHYFRSTPNSWEDKIIKLKALGCNCVETYVPWNLHEQRKGYFDFNFHLDLVKFIELATKHELLIILRMTPYICAEHEWGGLPYFLMKDSRHIRTDDERYLKHVRDYYNVMIPLVKPYFETNGGNIIMFQIENEYGSYGNDRIYLQKLVDMVKELGVDINLVTSDGTWVDMLESGELSNLGVLPTVNFGSGANTHNELFKKKINKEYPFMCMEFWCGWFTHWGDSEYNENDAKQVAKELDEILSLGSANFYMFHGGTNFGFNAGANYTENGYSPDITSYDYDALLDEAGNITNKYEECKSIISKYVDIPEIEVSYNKAESYGELTYIGYSNLNSSLDKFKCILNQNPLTHEELDQPTGFVVYKSNIKHTNTIENFQLLDCNDYARVEFNKEHFKSYYKEETKEEFIEFETSDNEISILTENMGRINYGPKMLYQEKGLKGVYVNNHLHYGWEHYLLSFEQEVLNTLVYQKEFINKPGFIKYELNLDTLEIYDTYLDMSNFKKGVVVVNGFNVGRYFHIGPQYSLYIPAEILNQGINEIIVFTIEGEDTYELNTIDKHIKGKVR